MDNPTFLSNLLNDCGGKCSAFWWDCGPSFSPIPKSGGTTEREREREEMQTTRKKKYIHIYIHAHTHTHTQRLTLKSVD